MVNLHILLVLGIILYVHWMRSVNTFTVPKPTKTQAKWLDYEVGAIVHFNMQTFNRYMKPGHVVPVDTFNPEELSTDQWLEAAKSFGAKYILFSIDHFSGFLMWPTATDYRRQACVCAVRNAKNKALEVVQILNQSLGPPMLIKEEHYEEYVGNNKEISLENKDMEHLTFQEKVALATVTVTIKIFAIFEIKEKMKVHKQK